MPGDKSGEPDVVDIIALYKVALPSLNDGHGPKSYVGKGSSLLMSISRLNDCKRALRAGDLPSAKTFLEEARQYTNFTTRPIEDIEKYLIDLELEISKRSR